MLGGTDAELIYHYWRQGTGHGDQVALFCDQETYYVLYSYKDYEPRLWRCMDEDEANRMFGDTAEAWENEYSHEKNHQQQLCLFRVRADDQPATRLQRNDHDHGRD
jgi:hypothetical protein